MCTKNGRLNEREAVLVVAGDDEDERGHRSAAGVAECTGSLGLLSLYLI